MRGLGLRIGLVSLSPSLIGMTLLESKIVGHAKNPATQVAPRLSQAQVAKQREKDLLNDFFSIVASDPKGRNITQQPAAISVKECNDFELQIGGVLGKTRSRHRRQRLYVSRV